MKKDSNPLLSWLGIILEYIKTYGFVNVIKSIIVLFIILTIGRYCLEPALLFKKYEEYAQQQHVTEIQNRLTNDDKINELMPSIAHMFNADRIWLLQYHNGTSDWLYASLRFRYVRPGVEDINKADYIHIPVSWLGVVKYLRASSMFIGDIETFKQIDSLLELQLETHDVKYIAVVALWDENYHQTGMLCIHWNDIPNYSDSQIETLLYKQGAILSNYLSPL